MIKSILFAGLLSSVALIGSALAQQTGSTDIGKVDVEGEGQTAPGAGFIVQEDSPKARSTITQAAIDQQPASSNVFQLINKLPGVNAYSTDPTGMLGGQLSIRGFNNDEIGFTVAGVPVNDSGNGAVFPQELIDAENMQEIDVTQGTQDIDQPQGFAAGGAVAIQLQEPTDKPRVKIVQSLGELNFFKSFGRLDTGNIVNSGFKAFISYSKGEANSWKGPGGINRDHIDFSAVYEDSRGDKFTASSIFNTEIATSLPNITVAQFHQFGRFFANEPNFYPLPTPAAGTAQNQASPAVPALSAYPGFGNWNPSNYYKYRVNPFTNEIATFDANIKILDNLRADIAPYYWNGYGNGGGFATLAEKATSITNNGQVPSTATQYFPAGFDLNGDGDKLDTIAYYRPSITSTQRPGVNAKMTYQPVDWDTVRVGMNYERSRHHQTQPFETINPDGSVTDLFASGTGLLTVNGVTVQGRDQLTFNTTKIFYIENTVTALNDALKIVVGMRRQEVDRDGHNNLPFILATNNPALISPSYDYLNYLPELQTSYKVNSENQIFANLQKSARAPSNYTLYENLFNTVGNQKQETSWDLDIGYRFQNDVVFTSLTMYAINFSNRNLSTLVYDQFGNSSTSDINAGSVHNRGVEGEIGTAKPIYGFDLYASASYNKSTVESNLLTGLGTVPTYGKNYVNTPKWKFASQIEYTLPQFPSVYIFVTPQYTSERYATLVNDQKIAGFASVDLGGGYNLPDFEMLHNAKIQFNVSNLLDRDYLFFGVSNSSTGITANGVTTNTGKIYAGSAPTYSIGPGRFFSVKIEAEF